MCSQEAGPEAYSSSRAVSVGQRKGREGGWRPHRRINTSSRVLGWTNSEMPDWAMLLPEEVTVTAVIKTMNREGGRLASRVLGLPITHNLIMSDS